MAAKNNGKPIEVIIDTPRGSRNKYHYELKKKKFRLKKVLPMGAAFPFDFGFIPGTKGGDGDPLDVLVLSDESSFSGCLVECRLIGVIEAEQKGPEGDQRNDRLIGVAAPSHLFREIHELSDLDEKQVTEIEHFFISYNRFEEREFIPLNRGDAAKARQIVQQGKKNKK